MRCPHLAKDVIYTCNFGRSPDVLESHALATYCKCAKFRSCNRYIDSKRHIGYYYQLEPAA
jgi:hypothetical protein